jgi:hypothetical protein
LIAVMRPRIIGYRSAAAQYVQGELQIARLPRDQRGHRRRREQHRGQRARTRVAQLAAQHACRRHAAQCEQRRQREAEQRAQAYRAALQRRQQRRRRQIREQQRGNQPRERGLHGPARGHAHGAGRDPQHAQLQRVDREHALLRCTQAAQQRGGVDVTLGVAPRRQRYRDAGEQHRDQCRQAEELTRARQRVADLRPRIAHALHLLAGRRVRREPRAHRVDAGRITAEQQAVTDPAARLHQPGALEVGQVRHHARRDAEHVAAAIGLVGEDVRNAKLQVAELDAIAHADLQQAGDPRVGPHLAARGPAARGAIGPIGGVGDLELAAQRVAVADELRLGELQLVAGQHHAAKRHGARALQPQSARLRLRLLARRDARFHQQVGAEQIGGAGLHRARHAVGEEAHAGHARHRDHQCRGQHLEFSRPPLAAQHAQRQRGHRAHGAATVASSRSSRPASSSTVRSQGDARRTSCVTSTSVVRRSRLRPNNSSMMRSPVR